VRNRQRTRTGPGVFVHTFTPGSGAQTELVVVPRLRPNLLQDRSAGSISPQRDGSAVSFSQHRRPNLYRKEIASGRGREYRRSRRHHRPGRRDGYAEGTSGWDRRGQ
jgi:hypothetical protein